MAYDPENIFAKILRGEIPCTKIYEDAYALAFADLYPKAPVHILVVPKRASVSHDDFVAHASDAEIAGFQRAIGVAAHSAGLTERGYRLISNSGADAHQEVPHYHVHILGGKSLGLMVQG